MTGRIWNDAVSDAFLDVLANWDDTFGLQVVEDVLATPGMPQDVDLKSMAWQKRPAKPDSLKRIEEAEREQSPESQARRRRDFAEGALAAWERMYPATTPLSEVPNWVKKARRFVGGGEWESPFSTEPEDWDTKRAEIEAEVKAHNAKRLEEFT